MIKIIFKIAKGGKMFRATAFFAGLIWVLGLVTLSGYLYLSKANTWIYILMWFVVGVVALIAIGAMKSWVANLVMTLVMVGFACFGYSYISDPYFLNATTTNLSALPWWVKYLDRLVFALIAYIAGRRHQ